MTKITHMTDFEPQFCWY